LQHQEIFLIFAAQKVGKVAKTTANLVGKVTLSHLKVVGKAPISTE